MITLDPIIREVIEDFDTNTWKNPDSSKNSSKKG